MISIDWDKNWVLFQEVPDCPLWLVACPLMAYNGEMSQKYGVGETHGIFAYQEGNLYMYVIKEEYAAAGKVMLEKTLKNTKFLSSILDSIESQAKKMILIAQDQINLDCKKLSEEDLWREYEKYHQAHHICWVDGQAINLLEMNQSLLLDHFEGLLSSFVSNEKLKEVVNILITPEQYTYGQKEEQELIQLALENKTDVTSHWNKYAWTGYDWGGPPWEKSYFVERIELLKNDPKLKYYVKSEEGYTASILNKKKKLVKEYKISNGLQHISKLLERIIYLKSLRVDASWQAYVAIEPVLLEIGHRKHLTLRQLKYVMPNEMKKLILADKFDVNILNERRKSSTFLFCDGYMDEIYGQESEDIYEKIQKKTAVNTNVNEVKGECGSPGRAEGIVKIINKPEDMSKMEKGNVLVSHATSPRLVPAMKKAIAIIADVGGITCHAAIVARELGVPCVIGTKIATKVLKDGDIVEVKANHGLVIIR
jgi:phosphohistidine swiveling domain-containing protein